MTGELPWIEDDLCSSCAACGDCKKVGSKEQCPTVEKRQQADRDGDDEALERLDAYETAPCKRK